MVKVMVKNNTSVNVKIQEGNAGVFVTRSTLKPDGEFILKLDPNATYREYVLIKLPDQSTLDPPFSSDDLLVFKKILIKEDKSAKPFKYSWKGISTAQESEDNLNSFLEELKSVPEGCSSQVGSSSMVGDGEKVSDLGEKVGDAVKVGDPGEKASDLPAKKVGDPGEKASDLPAKKVGDPGEKASDLPAKKVGDPGEKASDLPAQKVGDPGEKASDLPAKKVGWMQKLKNVFSG